MRKDIITEMTDNGRTEIDNSELEAIIEEFINDRTKENFVKIMELLEKAVIYLPAMKPENLDDEAVKMAKEGKEVKLPNNATITPCLLKKNTGEQVLPIFSLRKHIVKEGLSPAVLAMPFLTCVSMVMANSDKVESVVLNPFTQNITIPKQILEVAHKRIRAGNQKSVQITEQIFHQLAHKRISCELLPVFLYEKQKEGLEKMQSEAGKFLLSLYTSIYPAEIKVPYAEDDFSLMTLNVTENLQITRIDMPEKNMAKELCLRIYVVWKRDTETLDYFTIEKAENGNVVGRVHADRTHEIIAQAPENGTEIEMIMNLSS